MAFYFTSITRYLLRLQKQKGMAVVLRGEQSEDPPPAQTCFLCPGSKEPEQVGKNLEFLQLPPGWSWDTFFHLLGH